MKALVYSFLFLALSLIACNSSDDDTVSVDNTSNQTINEFIWNGLNSWYYYNDVVPSLANSYKGSTAYNSSVMNLTPEDWFASLRSSQDDFSWIVNDYVALENQFSGVYESYGFEFVLLRKSAGSNDLVGFIRYVLPGTQAASEGFKRGDLFLTINGSQITIDNYNTLLTNSTAVFGLATLDNSGLNLSGVTKTVSLAQIAENPVFLTKVITTTNNTKVGYVVYNSFTADYNQELNQAFAQLKAGGATELILDLRYNGGGSVETSAYLASMIAGQNNNSIFAKLAFNGNHTQYDESYFLNNQMNVYDKNSGAASQVSVNQLNVSKLYVIVSNNTASASEMIINGLRPYIPVILVGDTTVGKNEGSITLYDVPSNDYIRNDASGKRPNPNHTYAMQPIVFQIFNSQNMNDYDQGFTPDYSINELNYILQTKALGDPAEPLLNTALRLIDPTVVNSISRLGINYKQGAAVQSSLEMRPHSIEMYINK